MVRVPAVRKTGASGPDRMTSSNIGKDKSFVDDLNTERGIVRMREVFVPRSAEIQPWFFRFVCKPLHTFQNFSEASETRTPHWNGDSRKFISVTFSEASETRTPHWKWLEIFEGVVSRPQGATLLLMYSLRQAFQWGSETFGSSLEGLAFFLSNFSERRPQARTHWSHL
jgi:hypothetical protein